MHPARAVRGAEHRMWTVAVLAGLIGAVLATGTTLATRPMRTHNVSVPAVEQDVMTPVVTLAAMGASSMAANAADVRSSCAALIARDAHGTRSSVGVVFRSDGMMLAVAHMVDGAQSIQATVGDQRVAARVVASDPTTDLAVVKLDGSGYNPAPLGTALDVRIGDPVVALSPTDGNPVQGLVAAVGKTFSSQGNDFDGLLQITTSHATDTLGSPVLNRQGAVIGVATGIDAGKAEFATPMDWARQVAGQLLRTGRSVMVWLGVAGHDLSAAAAAALGVSGGAVIDKIYGSSPAQAAGLKVGDEVLGIDGRAVTSMANLIMAVRSHVDGTNVELDVRRDTATWGIRTLLAAKPASIS